MAWEEASPAMQETLSLLYAFCSASFFMIVILAIFIVLVYLRRLNSVSWMIIVFYGFTIL